MAEAGIEPSVGNVGDSCDDPLAETINGLLKAEVIRRREPGRSFEAVECATLEWVDWFNTPSQVLANPWRSPARTDQEHPVRRSRGQLLRGSGH